MKKLFFRLVLPLTYFSHNFVIERKCRIIIEDCCEKDAYGFPFVNHHDSLATSLDQVYYLVETGANVISHAFFWGILVYLIDRFWINISLPKRFATIALAFFSIQSFLFVYYSIEFNTDFRWTNDLDFTISDNRFYWFSLF